MVNFAKTLSFTTLINKLRPLLGGLSSSQQLAAHNLQLEAFTNVKSQFKYTKRSLIGV